MLYEGTYADPTLYISMIVVLSFAKSTVLSLFKPKQNNKKPKQQKQSKTKPKKNKK